MPTLSNHVFTWV